MDAVPVKRIGELPGTEYSDEETEFIRAMDAFKRKHRKPFPTFVDVLRVAQSLGYRRVAPAAPSAT